MGTRFVRHPGPALNPNIFSKDTKLGLSELFCLCEIFKIKIYLFLLFKN